MNHSFERIATGPQGNQTFKSAFNFRGLSRGLVPCLPSVNASEQDSIVY